jgi:hypothetical protein
MLFMRFFRPPWIRGFDSELGERRSFSSMRNDIEPAFDRNLNQTERIQTIRLADELVTEIRGRRNCCLRPFFPPMDAQVSPANASEQNTDQDTIDSRLGDWSLSQSTHCRWLLGSAFI